jgi:hypothetical protein
LSKLFTSLALVALSTIVGGATVDTWYSWFIAGPQGAFPELHDITFVQALGLCLFVGYFTYGLYGYLAVGTDDDDRNVALGLTYTLIAIGWLFALLYHFVLS